MAEYWVRLWAGTTTDPKWQTIARKSGRPKCEVIAMFMHLMMLANEAEERGSVADVVLEDVVSALDLDDEVVESIWAAMQGRVINNDRLTGWEKRQPAREDSGDEKTGSLLNTERSRLFRERKRIEAELQRDATQGNDTQRDATQGNTPEAETEADIKTLSNTHTFAPTTAPDGDVCVQGSALPTLPTAPTPQGEICRQMRAAGVAVTNPSNQTLRALIEAGATPEEFASATQTALSKGKSNFNYIVGIVQKQREDAAKLVLHQGELPRQRDSPKTRREVEKQAVGRAIYGNRSGQNDIDGECRAIN